MWWPTSQVKKNESNIFEAEKLGFPVSSLSGISTHHPPQHLLSIFLPLFPDTLSPLQRHSIFCLPSVGKKMNPDLEKPLAELLCVFFFKHKTRIFPQSHITTLNAFQKFKVQLLQTNNLDLDTRSKFYVRTNLHKTIRRGRNIMLKWESKKQHVIKMWTSEQNEWNRFTYCGIFNLSYAIPPVWTSARSLKSCTTDSKRTRATLCSVQLWGWDCGMEGQKRLKAFSVI